MPHVKMQHQPGRPGRFGPVRELPRKVRVTLTKGPTATVEVILAGDGTQRAVVSCPRNALKAFSELAKRLLVSDEHTNLQIPAGNVALGALRYIMSWIPRCCEAADFMRKSLAPFTSVHAREELSADATRDTAGSDQTKGGLQAKRGRLPGRTLPRNHRGADHHWRPAQHAHRRLRAPAMELRRHELHAPHPAQGLCHGQPSH
ncbi:uncharacterized protein BKA78DRAFT_322290 [Phyllosticta capitalensis]|uniref:uncharacterized protein n=1 Tax=Phyllosticta capitalensis TaxID=121624 RepID=UPI003130D465